MVTVKIIKLALCVANFIMLIFQYFVSESEFRYGFELSLIATLIIIINAFFITLI
jgi:hypothetical protein